MAYQCPRCGRPVQRYIGTDVHKGGLVGILFSGAFGSFVCKRCTWIRLREFPPEIRKEIVLSSVLKVNCAIGLLIGLMYSLVFLERW